jgi:hypothetical protein
MKEPRFDFLFDGLRTFSPKIRQKFANASPHCKLAKLSAGRPYHPTNTQTSARDMHNGGSGSNRQQRPDGRPLRANAQFDRTGMPARGETSGKLWQAGMNEWVLSKSIRSLLKNQ